MDFQKYKELVEEADSFFSKKGYQTIEATIAPAYTAGNTELIAFKEGEEPILIKLHDARKATPISQITSMRKLFKRVALFTFQTGEIDGDEKITRSLSFSKLARTGATWIPSEADPEEIEIESNPPLQSPAERATEEQNLKMLEKYGHNSIREDDRLYKEALETGTVSLKKHIPLFKAIAETFKEENTSNILPGLSVIPEEGSPKFTRRVSTTGKTIGEYSLKEAGKDSYELKLDVTTTLEDIQELADENPELLQELQAKAEVVIEHWEIELEDFEKPVEEQIPEEPLDWLQNESDSNLLGFELTKECSIEELRTTKEKLDSVAGLMADYRQEK